jgi:triphosphatase
MTVRTALLAALRASSQHILANRDCNSTEICPEAIHQLRIAASRIGGILSIFRKVMKNDERVALMGELRWFRQQLGPAREWDVFIDETIASLSKNGQFRRDMEKIIAVADLHRISAHQNARKVLLGRRFNALLRHLQLWVDVLSQDDLSGKSVPAKLYPRVERNQKQLAKPVTDWARKALHAHHLKVRKIGRRISRLSDAELHKLRMRVKRLRYTMELFQDIFDTQSSHRYTARLQELQSVLGSIHDATIAGELIQSICLEADVAAEISCGEVLKRISAFHKDQKRQLQKLWKDYRKAGDTLK